MIIKSDFDMYSFKDSVKEQLEQLYNLSAGDGEFISEELVQRLASLTGTINREIAVYIDRKGRIVDVSVGDNSTVSLPEVEGRRGNSRLSGIRCIHTHPNGEGMLSAVDINSMQNLRLDAMAAIGVNEGKLSSIYAALPLPQNGEVLTEIYGPFYQATGDIDGLLKLIAERDKIYDACILQIDETEKAILVGLETKRGQLLNGKTEGERLLNELEELAATAGVIVLDKVIQRKAFEDTAFFLGKGKIEEINLLRQARGANLLIFDDELSGAQIRNIEDITGIKVIDRTTLILDIFAQRARSIEGKLQVELAQLKYRLPRLIGLGNQLSRLGGGIGTRGPGEKKLEVDRRHIRRRITVLEKELREIEKRRTLMREARKKNELPVIALVGYTNAGKSTLMNYLCGSDVFAENKLFATLDPTTRKLPLPDGRKALLVDTVGFIRKLPHDLVDAFKSTLEETVHADLLLHVVDMSSSEAEIQISVVNNLLESLGAMNKPVILVQNKADISIDDHRVMSSNLYERVFTVSAVTGQGMENLLKGITELAAGDEISICLVAPYNEGWILPYLYDYGTVVSSEYSNDGIVISANIKKSRAEKVRKYIINGI